MRGEQPQGVLPSHRLTERENIKSQVIRQLQLRTIAQLLLNQERRFLRHRLMTISLPLTVILYDRSRMHTSFMVRFVYIGFQHFILNHRRKILKVSHLDIMGHPPLFSNLPLFFKSGRETFILQFFLDLLYSVKLLTRYIVD